MFINGNGLDVELNEGTKAAVRCYAKINLFLEVTGKREDGYHTIDSVMQKVSLCDRIFISVSEGEGVRLFCDAGDIPAGEDNIAVAAARKYLAAAGVRKRVDIRLEKKIPVAAGLAGGSADAAGTLAALHLLVGGVDDRALFEVALSVGADVPFCLFSVSALCENLGEAMTESPSLPACYAVIAKHPAESVSTKEAYLLIDACRRQRVTSRRVLDSLNRRDLSGVCACMKNDFEAVILPRAPLAAKALSVMESFSARRAMMSGSGPAVYGIFDGREQAAAACGRLESLGYLAFVCRPLENRRPI